MRPVATQRERLETDAVLPAASRRRRFAVAKPWQLFVLVFVLAFLNFAAWSVATPLFASPDEPAHVVRAAAIVRGQLVGRTVKDAANAYTKVTIPRVFAAGGTYAQCFAFRATTPASCAHPITSSTKAESATTYVGRYPPLYYVLVGLPSLGSVSVPGIYLMRLASALLSAVFVALALYAVVRWSRRRLLAGAVLAALTPMTWFLGGMVNPNGFEISAAICLWTAGLVLVREHPERPPPGLVAIVAGSAAGLMLSRPISPLWVAIIAAVLAIMGGRPIAGVVRSRAARWAAVPLAACGAFALWWIVAKHALDLTPGIPVSPQESGLQLVRLMFDQTDAWVHQMVGVFGWLDTFAPLYTYVVWLAVWAAALALALIAGIREAVAVVVTVVLVVALPVAISADQAHRLGIIWQGRYTLPLAVGVPLIAAACVRVPGALRRWRAPAAAVVSAALAVAAMAAYLQALRRYSVGANGPLDFLDGRWHPPLGSAAVAVAGCALIGLLWIAVVAGAWRLPLLRVGPAGDRRAEDHEDALDRRRRSGALGHERTPGSTTAAP